MVVLHRQQRRPSIPGVAMIIKFATISKYNGMFEKCYMEPVINGCAIFDSKNNHIGHIYDEGFALNSGYNHSEAVKIQLEEKGIAVFDVDIHDQTKLQEMIDEIS